MHPITRRTFLKLPALAPLAGAMGMKAVAAAAPRVLWRTTVYRHPSADPYDLTNRYGFNHAASVVALPDGRLLAAWFSGPFEASVHQVILSSISSDGGKSWSPAAVLQDFPRRSDFDPAFIRDGGRTWFFFSAGRWNRYPFVREEGARAIGPDSFRTWARRSDDSGRTWSEPSVVAERRGCRSNGIRLDSGELLLPTYDFGDRTAGVMRSADGGKSWQLAGRLTTPAGADEPTIAQADGGTVLMLLRTTDGFLWRSRSRDRGVTWSAPEKTDMVAAAASHNLFRTRDGRLVLTHDASKPPLRTPLTVRVSSDAGETWGEPLVLAEVPVPREGDAVWGRQATYPSVAQLGDGALVVVWAEIVLSDLEQYGDIRAARVELD
jgi:hypothetical protein